jgi:hypothetical protein
VIHRFPIPFADDPMWPDVSGWLRNWGWAVTGFERHHDRLHMPRPIYRLALKSYMEPAELVVSSGTILIYDDIERSLGVTSKPEPQDAVPTGFTQLPVDMPMLRDRSYDPVRWLPWPLGPKRGAL